MVSRYLDMTLLGDQPFEKAVKGKQGTYLRRNSRWYADSLGEISAKRATTLDEALSMFAELRKLHLARFRARGERTSLADESVVEFHSRLISALWRQGSVDLLRVGSDSATVGYLYNFVIGPKVYVFQTGFAYETSGKWSPGLLSHNVAIEYYRLRGGIAEYDFLAGDALYKRVLANAVHDLTWTTVYRDHWAMTSLLQVRRLTKMAAARIPMKRSTA